MASLRCLVRYWARFEVGDGAGHFQDAVVSPGGETQLGDGVLQQLSPSAEIVQCFRSNLGGIWALEYVFFPRYSASTGFVERQSPLAHRVESSAVDGDRSSLYFTAGTSM